MSTYYNVQISLNSQFSSLVVNVNVEDVSDYTVTKDLTPFTMYYWRVKSIDPMTGAESSWSNTCAFRIKATNVTVTQTSTSAYIRYYGLTHAFVRDYDKTCHIPNAIIGSGCTSGVADIGDYSKVCTPTWGGYELEYILTEDSTIISTEDGVFGLLLESVQR